jgi:DNA-binding SARP family transcriptional activator
VTELQSFIDNYHGLFSPRKNISLGLRSVRNVYDADLAFILEMDSTIRAFRVMFAEFRDGLEGFGDILCRNLIAKELFSDIIKKDTPVCFTTEGLEETHPEECEWMELNGVRDVMLRPFITRAQMEVFAGVCNTSRLFGDLSMLAFTTVLLTNEIRSITVYDKLTKIQNHAIILEDNDVVINMFGGFEILTRRGKIDFGNSAPSKCCLLLIYLIFNRDRVVPVRELAEMLAPDQLFDVPYNMIKGVVFRLRQLLKPICEKEIVVARQGTYTLNPELLLMLDADDFEKTCGLLGNEEALSEQDKADLYKRAISCFKGNLLPNFEDELWLIGKINYFQIKYATIVKKYLSFLEQNNMTEEFFSVISQVQNVVFSDGDIFNYIIKMLVRLNRMDLAKNCFLKAEKLLLPEQRQSFINLWNKR